MTDVLLDRLNRFTLRPSPPSAWAILTLWRQGMDTFDIAKQLDVPEHDIANRLVHIREKAGVRHG